jgi:hypothetical protein
VEGSCELGNEPLGSLRSWEILQELSDWCLEGMKLVNVTYAGTAYRKRCLRHIGQYSVGFRVSEKLTLHQPLMVNMIPGVAFVISIAY